MPPHHLTNFKIQKYYQNKTKFNGAYSRNNLPKIKDKAYAINLDEFKSVGTYQIALNVNGNDITYFNSFADECIPKEIEKFIGHRNITTNTFTIAA